MTSHNSDATGNGAMTHSTSPEGGDLVAHVKRIRNTIRQLQGLDPIPEEADE